MSRALLRSLYHWHGVTIRAAGIVICLLIAGVSLGIATAYVGPRPPFILAVGVCLGLLMISPYTRPFSILFTLPVGGFALPIAGKTPEILLADLLIIIMVTLHIPQLLATRDGTPAGTEIPTMMPILASLALAAIALGNLPLSPDPARSLARTWNVIICPLLIVFIYQVAPKDAGAKKSFSRLLPIFACVFCLLQFAVLFSQTGKVFPDLVSRNTGGIFKSSLNYTAAISIFLAVVAAGIFAEAPTWRERIPAGLAYAAGTIMALISGSRSGLITLLAGTAILFLLVRGRRRSLLLGLLLVTSIASILVALHAEDTSARAMSVFGADAASNTMVTSDADRLAVFKQSWREFLSHPLFGSGFRDFHFPLSRRFMPAHSAFLELLTGLGLSGLILYTALILFFITYIRRCKESPLAAGLLAGLAAAGASVALQPFLTTGREINIIVGVVIGYGLRTVAQYPAK